MGLSLKAYVRGRLVDLEDASVSVLDRGYLYGEGCFETVCVYNSRPFRLKQHLRRLSLGLERLHISRDVLEGLDEAVKTTIRENRMERGLLRITVTRKNGRGIPNPKAKAHVVITPHPEGLRLEGESVRLCPFEVLGEDPFPGVKHLGYAPWLLLALRAREMGFDDALLLDKGEVVIGTSQANLLYVRDGMLLVPTSEYALAGITREAIEEIARVSIKEARREVTRLSDLRRAEEIFITSSGLGVRAVSEVMGVFSRSPEKGSVTEELHRRYVELLDRETRD